MLSCMLVFASFVVTLNLCILGIPTVSFEYMLYSQNYFQHLRDSSWGYTVRTLRNSRWIMHHLFWRTDPLCVCVYVYVYVYVCVCVCVCVCTFVYIPQRLGKKERKWCYGGLAVFIRTSLKMHSRHCTMENPRPGNKIWHDIKIGIDWIWHVLRSRNYSWHHSCEYVMSRIWMREKAVKDTC